MGTASFLNIPMINASIFCASAGARAPYPRVRNYVFVRSHEFFLAPLLSKISAFSPLYIAGIAGISGRKIPQREIKEIC